MARREPEELIEIDGRLEYVRGLLEGGELPDGPRRDQALGRLTDLVAELSREVRGLRIEVRELRQRDEPAEQAVGPLYCPGCGQEIALDSALASRGPVELTCENCRSVLEIE